MPLVRKHVFISGVVQGVFYRATTRQQAERLGLVGWARNLADGRVEAVVEGEEEAVARIVAWFHEGPPGAHVTGVEVADEKPTGEFGRFVVRR
jgi:acylphosphatase